VLLVKQAISLVIHSRTEVGSVEDLT